MTPRLSPVQLALRFAIEVSAFFGIGAVANAWGGRLVAIGALVVFGCIWTVFNVKGDPSRSGGAPVPVPGALRLVLELLTLTCGAIGFFLTGRLAIAVALGVFTIVHYGATWSRTMWLLGRYRSEK